VSVVARGIAVGDETPEQLGLRVADDLRRQGADDLLAGARSAEELRHRG
jgi:hypothetical protein